MAEPNTKQQPQTQAKPATMMTTPQNKTPFRQIRAHYDADTIVVYQAYNEAIATAAVKAQRLDASPLFRTTRMTWIKPSWAWMLYRAGYSYKDPGQARVLALRMRHADFAELLGRAVLTTHDGSAGGDSQAATSGAQPTAAEEVKVQWDPERTVRLAKLEHRSIQIGIPAALSGRWVSEWIVGIEDVTDRARELKRVLDEKPDISDEELVRLGLVPEERPFVVSESLQRRLGMI